MAKYVVSDCWCHIEEDTYEDGCIGGLDYKGRKGYETGFDLPYLVDEQFDTLDEIGERIAEEWDVAYTPECMHLEDWDELNPGRVDLAWEVRGPNGGDPTEEEWKEFREGKRIFCSLTVSFIVEKVSQYTYSELKEALEKERAEEARQTA